MDLKKIIKIIDNKDFLLAEKLLVNFNKIDPDNIEILNLLAIVFAHKKNFSKSINIYLKILERKPNFQNALINIGNVYKEILDYNKSIYYFKKAIDNQPNNFFLILELAKIFDLNLNYSSANKLYLKLILHKKNDDQLLCHYSNNLILTRNYIEAERILFNILKNKNFYIEALILISFLEKEKGNLKRAIDYLILATKKRKNYYKIYSNLGYLFLLIGDFDKAKKCILKSIKLNPHYKVAHFNYSLYLLYHQNFSEGWQYYKFRNSKINFQNLFNNEKIWDGKYNSGELVIYNEQGLGDEIQFSSIYKNIIDYKEKIIVKCDKRLVSLFTRSFPKFEFVAKNYIIPEKNSQKHILAGDLGAIFRKNINDFSIKKWIKVDPKLVKKYDKIFSNKKIRIGVAWLSSNLNSEIIIRSLMLQDIVNILPENIFELIDIQYGETQKERLDLKVKKQRELIHFDSLNYKNDLDDLAAIITNCDLIISVGSFTASFAGSLGKEVYVILPSGSHWAWSSIENISIWFPSVKTFKQEKFGHWQDVYENISNYLKKKYKFK
tara:strand:+ start:109 stop:1761 length:1653 start_codon:yes stop_codon:yes gene_type:complete